MTDRSFPQVIKWPFYLGDLLLVLVAVWIAGWSSEPFGLWSLCFTLLSVGLGAWLCVLPFLVEHRAAMRFAEADRLASAVAKIDQLETVAGQIGLASSHWQDAQEQSEKTVGTAREVATLMATEVKGFKEFLERANNAEKNYLKLEAEKARRAEGDWLQIMVRVLDHVHALYQAGIRSGQPNVREQLGHFQNACRDAVRRLGLVPFEATIDQTFDEKRHQLLEGDGKPLPGAQVVEAVAAGYTFQGQLLRRALVKVKAPPASETRQNEVEACGDDHVGQATDAEPGAHQR